VNEGFEDTKNPALGWVFKTFAKVSIESI